MPPPSATTIGRRRRRLGLALLILALPVAVAWACSGWWAFGIQLGQVGLAAWDGHTSLWWTDNPDNESVFWSRERSDGPVWDVYMHSGDFAGSASTVNLILADIYAIDGSTKYRGCRAVLWFPALALPAAGACLLVSSHRARRSMGGACAACGYSLTGLQAGATCPECGKSSRPS